MNTEDLGTISDKLLIFGGAYGNLQALTRLKEIAESQNFNSMQIIFTGDAAAYCAHPEECIQLIKKWDIYAIAGNVEIQLREESDDCGCNFEAGTTCERLSRQWYPYVQQKVSPSSLEWMHQLPDSLRFSINGYTVQVVHGSYTDVSQYVFKSTGWKVKHKEFDAAGSDIIIGGHCGIPFSDHQTNRLWFNAGVIGMPANDNTPRAWYATAEPADSGILLKHHSFEYDHHQTAEAMKSENLPSEYWKTLCSGIWDNCDILPDQETREQGNRLSLSSTRWPDETIP